MRCRSTLGSVLVLACALLPGCRVDHLVAITVTPGAGSETLTAAGQTAQYKAIGTYRDGQAPLSTSDISATVSWSVSNPGVATVSAAGLVTAAGAGKTTITAQTGGIVATSDITVTPAPVIAPTLTLTPGTSTLTAIGQTAKFLATGDLHGSGTTQDVTDQVAWVSSNTLVAAVNQLGTATAVGAGTTTITAKSGGLVATAVLTVTPAAAIAPTLTVTPGTAALTGAGQTLQLTATGDLHGTGVVQNVTNSVAWISSNASVATIDQTGFATVIGAGTTTITAQSGGLIASSVVTVTIAAVPPVSPALVLIPGTSTAQGLGETTQFLAIGDLAGTGVIEDVTNRVKWGTSEVGVATINQSGLSLATGAGTTTITAEFGGTVASSTVTVTTAATAGSATPSLTIIPPAGTVTTPGETVEFLAIGDLSGSGKMQILTSQVAWGSSDKTVATIDQSGVATAVGANGGANSTTITAIAATPDGSVLSATGTITETTGSARNLPSLSVYSVGTGAGIIASSPSGLSSDSCTLANPCVGYYAPNTAVKLTAAESAGSIFAGWSANCIPDPTSSQSLAGYYKSCTVKLTNDSNVGAVFNQP